jgi:hypothetical protein
VHRLRAGEHRRPRGRGAFQTRHPGDDDIPADIDEDLRPALELGRRVGRYLAIVGADEADRAAQLWPELRAALEDFASRFGNPWRDKALVELAEGRASSRRPAPPDRLREDRRARWRCARRRGSFPSSPASPTTSSPRPRRCFASSGLTVPQLLAFHRQQGGTLSDAAALAAVLAPEWNLDGDAWDELLPPTPT